MAVVERLKLESMYGPFTRTDKGFGRVVAVNLWR